MKKCATCGRENPVDSSFCGGCGGYLGWSSTGTSTKHGVIAPSEPVVEPVVVLRPEPAPPTVDPGAPLTETVSALEQARLLAEQCRRPDLGRHLEDARARLVAQVLGVAVVGEFKRGKSTLVNALLQTDICPVDADIVTAVPTLVRYGETPQAVAHFSPAGETGAPTVDESVDVDQLVDLVSEAADPARRARLQSVEVWLPHRLLGTGVCLVDTPGVGGLESAHGAVTLSALGQACGMIFVTDASQELTEPEMRFLRQALERTPTAVCVVTKTDLYPQWRRIVELNRRHLAEAGIDLPVVPVSSFLRLRAWRSEGLNDESGFAALFDWIRTEVIDAVATEAVTAASRDLGFVKEQLNLEIVAEQRVIRTPEDGPAVVRQLQGRSDRTRRLMQSDSPWQQVLSDGIEDLIADVRHDLAERMRTLTVATEQVIEQGDPKETWSAVDVWLHRQVVMTATANYDLLERRAQALSAEVAKSFAAESGAPLTLGLSSPGELLRGLSLSQDLPSPGDQGLARMVFAGRTAVLVPSLVFGMVGSNMALLVAMGPIALLLGAGLGRKLIRDERLRQLVHRRQQAKMACKRYVDEAAFVFGKDCADSLRRTRRELRDEFQNRAAVLHESSQRALVSAERATELEPQERQERAVELADQRREVEALTPALVRR
jgi:GTPase SAR1 family protein